MKQSVSIERPVGEGETNRSSDLEAVRNALAERGFCRRSITGQWNAKYKQDLTAGIRLFQRQSGLQPDGIVIPGGPTAFALALGGEVQVKVGTPAHLSPDCLQLVREMADIQTEIPKVEAEIDVQDRRRLAAKAERDRAINDLRRLARDLDLRTRPTIGNLNNVRREVENLPDDAGPKVLEALSAIQRAASSNSALLRHEDSLKKKRATLQGFNQALQRLKIRFGRECGR